MNINSPFTDWLISCLNRFQRFLLIEKKPDFFTFNDEFYKYLFITMYGKHNWFALMGFSRLNWISPDVTIHDGYRFLLEWVRFYWILYETIDWVSPVTSARTNCETKFRLIMGRKLKLVDCFRHYFQGLLYFMFFFIFWFHLISPDFS